MNFEFKITATLDHVSGQFAGKDQFEDEILEALEAADPQQLTGDGGGEYEMTEWEVTSL